jgi:hypothetical protein
MQRTELRSAKNYYTEAVVKGTVLGAVAGGLAGAHFGGSDAAAILTGAVAGAVVGGMGSYYLVKQKVAADARQLAASIHSDILADNAQIDRATVAFAKLRECRFEEARQVKADFIAGRIDREQALSRLNALKQRFGADVEIAEAIDVKIASRAKEFEYASAELIKQDPEAQAYLAVREAEKRQEIEAAKKPVKKKLVKKKSMRKKTSLQKKPAPPPDTPVVAVATITETNQVKQKAFADDVQKAKALAEPTFSLEGTVHQHIPGLASVSGLGQCGSSS